MASNVEVLREWQRSVRWRVQRPEVQSALSAAISALERVEALEGRLERTASALQSIRSHVARMMRFTADYLVPDGLSKDRFVNGIIELLDGPTQRAAFAPALALDKELARGAQGEAMTREEGLSIALHDAEVQRDTEKARADALASKLLSAQEAWGLLSARADALEADCAAMRNGLEWAERAFVEARAAGLLGSEDNPDVEEEFDDNVRPVRAALVTDSGKRLLEEHAAKVARLEVELERLRTEVGTLKLKALNSEAELESKLQASEKAKLNEAAHRADLERRIAELEAQIAECICHEKPLAPRLVEARRALADAREEHNSALAAKDKRISELEAALALEADDRRCAETECSKLRGTIALMKEALERALHGDYANKIHPDVETQMEAALDAARKVTQLEESLARERAEHQAVERHLVSEHAAKVAAIRKEAGEVAAAHHRREAELEHERNAANARLAAKDEAPSLKILISALRDAALGWPLLAENAKAAADALERTEALAAAFPLMKEALEEIVDLMEAVRTGDYKPDSFTTQPARAALDAARKVTT
jgi:hypothetical protein